jgi:signal peptidase I
LLALVLAVAIIGLVRSLWIDVYYIPSESMEPLLETGDRILVSRTAFSSDPIHRGDVVVFDGRGSFAPLSSGKGPLVDAVNAAAQWFGLAGSDTTYVKRVLGVPGDHVQCCDASGKLTVNGQLLAEPYVYPGDEPSKQKFDVVVPEGRLWLMGDHRARSADSRALLGAPGGGMVPIDRVIGKPVRIIWPLDRFAEMPDSPQAAPTKNGH